MIYYDTVTEVKSTSIDNRMFFKQFLNHALE